MNVNEKKGEMMFRFWNANRFLGLSGLMVAILCALASADYSDTVLLQNPIGYWRLNETADDEAANLGTAGSDFNGEYYNGAQGVPGPDELVDGTELTGMGPDNLAYGMEDVDQYVQVFDSPIENLSKFTMTGWVKSDMPQAARTGLFGQNDSIEFGLNPGEQMNVWFPNTGGLSYALPDGEFLDEAWYHVGLVGTGQNVQFYVNGEQVAVGGSALPGSAGYGASDFTFNIGGGGIFDGIDANDGNQFTGTVDEIAMWDVALTDVQVQSMWDAANQAGGDFTNAVLATNPLGYWPLNETSGTVAANVGVGRRRPGWNLLQRKSRRRGPRPSRHGRGQSGVRSWPRCSVVRRRRRQAAEQPHGILDGRLGEVRRPDGHDPRGPVWSE